MIQLISPEKCTGCSACQAACPREAIAMVPDAQGFPYPHVDASRCVDCGLCTKACPLLHSQPESETTSAWAAWALDGDLRRQSTSGGVFSLVAQEILAQGGAVFGAAYDPDFRVRHICVTDPQDLWQLRGAKYAQSDLGDSFSRVRRMLSHGPVLFSGTPCQIAGLKSWLGPDCHNLFTLDLVCHSVPAPKVWEAYLKSLTPAGARPLSVNLRDKSSGWSHYGYSHMLSFSDGSQLRIPAGDSHYMQLFTRGYLSRPGCAHCAFKGCQRVSDLTLGDFWGIWDLEPQWDDNGGSSLVLCHTASGLAMLRHLAPQLALHSVPLPHTYAQNPALISSMAPHPQGEKVRTRIARQGFDAGYRLSSRPSWLSWLP